MYSLSTGSQWFREHGYLHSGRYSSLDDFIKHEWENRVLAWDANDLLTLKDTWMEGDVSTIHVEDGGDLGKALGRVKAKGLIMPCKTDLYFPVRVSFPSTSRAHRIAAGRQ